VFNQLYLGRGRHPYVTSPLNVFAAKLSFEFHGLNNWTILLLGLCYLILGLSPVQKYMAKIVWSHFTTALRWFNMELWPTTWGDFLVVIIGGTRKGLWWQENDIQMKIEHTRFLIGFQDPQRWQAISTF
jgi:hypothetical protein